MSNFQFLLSHPEFVPFGEIAASAEKILPIDPAACILNCRRSMEFAIKWMYSVDHELEVLDSDNLQYLMHRPKFRQLVGQELHARLDFIRIKGNLAAHSTETSTTEEVAMICLENLHIFLDFVAHCYSENHQQTEFDPSLIQSGQIPSPHSSIQTMDFATLLEENRKLKEQLTARREEHRQTYVTKPLDISEYETRKFYIDAMLEDAGWIEGKNWRNEVSLEVTDGKPSEVADYVLYDDEGKALAIVEAKATGEDITSGQEKARLHGKLLSEIHSRVPVIFLTNGFDTCIIDRTGVPRNCAAIYSKEDLEKHFRLQRAQTPLDSIVLKERIADRYYQKNAVEAVCAALRQHQEGVLLGMASGSGKTRTVIALCEILLCHRQIKNVLFLADREALATQAERAFAELLPELPAVSPSEEMLSPDPQCVFTTYEAISEAIDSVQTHGRKLLTCGYFDLVICDEILPSVYETYRDIFTYFDAPLIALTATPKEEIPKKAYESLGISGREPTYSYAPSQAIADGYLVDFLAVETSLRFAEDTIPYDQLPKEPEPIQNGEEGSSDKILSSSLSKWTTQEDTIRQALHVLMSQGLKVHSGTELGKTILFSTSHRHSVKIAKIFAQAYPHLKDHIQVIDSTVENAQELIDAFADPKKLPRIAISADLLDTGIDIPACLNLVFFKKVLSKAKFRQMVGRGSRPCPGLQDGKDKEQYYIFDFCGNLETFRMKDVRSSSLSVTGAIFCRKAQIALRLQEPAYQGTKYKAYRQRIVEDLVAQVRSLNKDSFAVRQHLKYVEIFSDPQHYSALTSKKLLHLEQEIAPLLEQGKEDLHALRFDALLYGLELATLLGIKYSNGITDLRKKVGAIGAIPRNHEISACKGLIQKILHTDHVETAGVLELEEIRKSLRPFLKLIPTVKPNYITKIYDDLSEMNGA